MHPANSGSTSATLSLTACHASLVSGDAHEHNLFLLIKIRAWAFASDACSISVPCGSSTVGKQSGNYPDSIWKKRLLMAEHSPIRRLDFPFHNQFLLSYFLFFFILELIYDYIYNNAMNNMYGAGFDKRKYTRRTYLWRVICIWKRWISFMLQNDISLRAAILSISLE